MQLSPGDQCDIQDGEQQWHLGEVVSSGTTKDFVRVQLVRGAVGAGPGPGGAEQAAAATAVAAAAVRNLTLPRTSARLAEAGTRSGSGGRRGGAEEGGACAEMTQARLEEVTQRAEGLGRGDREGEGEGWQEVVEAVETLLSSSHPPALVPAVNGLLKAALGALVRVLQAERSISDEQLHLLQKLLFVDR